MKKNDLNYLNRVIYYISNIFLNPSALYSIVKGKLTQDILYTLSNSLWRIVSGPVTLIFIPLFLTPEIQGYWYTFGSLAALAIFADLGFTTIVAQFSAHEYAHLNFNKQKGTLEGDMHFINRITSLFRFVLKWAVSVSVIGFPFILLIGFWMFSGKDEHVNWVLPWVIYVFVTGINFTIGTILSFLEGCNQIAEIQKNRIISAITSSIAIWIFLASGFNLYTLAFTSLLGSGLSIFLLFFRFKKLLVQLFKKNLDLTITWKNDFLKLIWKYAISWSSGYFIFQIYVPLTFSNFGAIEAGRVGISMTLATAMFAIANVWVYVSIPKFNMMASKKDWVGMDKLLRISILLSASTFILGMAFVLTFMLFFSDQFEFLKRFLGFVPMVILLIAWLIQIIINTIAVYLRAHKQEPLVWLSLFIAIFITISTFLISKFFKSDYLFLGFLLSQSFALPTTLYLLRKKRLQWH